MRRIAGPVVLLALALTGAGCGDDEKSNTLLTEDGLRQCLADAGFGARATEGSGGYLLLFPAPDFVVEAEDSTDVSATVYGTEEKAERAAADARGATQTLGDPVEIVSKRNAMLIFNPVPSGETRQAAESCL